MLDEHEQDSDYHNNDARPRNLTAIIVVAAVVLILGLASLIIQTPNAKGLDQPVIVVLFQTLRDTDNVPGPTAADTATPQPTSTMTPTTIPTATAMPEATNTPTSQSTELPSPTPDETNATVEPSAVDLSSSECAGLTRTGTNTSVSLSISVPAGMVQYFGGLRFDTLTDPAIVTIVGPYSGNYRLFGGMFCGAVPVGSAEEDIARATIERELRIEGIACDLGACPVEINLP